MSFFDLPTINVIDPTNYSDTLVFTPYCVLYFYLLYCDDSTFYTIIFLHLLGQNCLKKEENTFYALN